MAALRDAREAVRETVRQERAGEKIDPETMEAL